MEGKIHPSCEGYKIKKLHNKAFSPTKKQPENNKNKNTKVYNIHEVKLIDIRLEIQD
jgi:hypothetical protein